MKPVKFKEANVKLVMPAGQEGESLHVLRKDGLIMSVWHPSDDDMKVLRNGGFIALFVAGSTQPPLKLQAIPYRAVTEDVNKDFTE